jgi:cytochrome P450
MILLYLIHRLFRRFLFTSFPHHTLLPPGPTGLPLIGNLLDWPKDRIWATLAQWAVDYGTCFVTFHTSHHSYRLTNIGDIVHVNLAGTHVIILNSPENTSALLDSKNAPSSDRPSMYFAGNMVGWDKIFTMLRDGPRLKTTRRLVAQEIGSRAEITRFVPQIEAQTYAFILKVLDNPSAEMLPRYIRKLVPFSVFSLRYKRD